MFRLLTFSIIGLIILASVNTLQKASYSKTAVLVGREYKTISQQEPTSTNTQTTDEEEKKELYKLIDDFYPNYKTYGEGIFKLIDELPRGEESIKAEEKETEKYLSKLNIWCYNPTGKFWQITRSGGYSYPRTSPNSSQICFIKDNKIYTMDIDGKNETIVNDEYKYKKVLAWNLNGDYLVTTISDQVYRLAKQEKKVKVVREIPVSKTNSKYLTLEFIKLFSDRYPNLNKLYAVKNSKGFWAIAEDSTSYRYPKVIFEDTHINLAPCRISSGEVIFVSDRL